MTGVQRLLSPFGGQNDQAYQSILTWCESNRRKVNSNELSLLGFKRWSAGRRVWVPFSAETIARKARKLAEWGLLDRGHDSQGHTWYCWPDGKTTSESVQKIPVRVYHPDRTTTVTHVEQDRIPEFLKSHHAELL